MSDPDPPVPGGLLEAAIYAGDLDAAEAFYGDLLGLDRIARSGQRHVFYRCGRAVLLVFNPAETAHPTSDAALPVPPHGATGPGHVCFAMAAPEIAAMRRRLLDAGIAIEADFHWPNGARSVYVRDPAGNSVEFAEPKLWGF